MLKGVKKIVLNLDSRKDRLFQITEELERAGIEDWVRFSAISHPVGYMGYNKSIKAILEANKDEEYLMIIEDDCLF